MNIPDEAVEAETKLFWNEVLGRSDWEEFSQEHPDEADIVRDNRRCILEAAAPFIIAAKRKKMDLQSEVLEAWYTITKHEVFSPCYAEERPLLHSMLDRLTNLAEMERTVNELRKSSTDDEIRADERKKIADEIIEITGGDTGPRSGGYYMVSMRDIMRVFKTEGSKDS
jgi:hypothetical protein